MNAAETPQCDAVAFYVQRDGSNSIRVVYLDDALVLERRARLAEAKLAKAVEALNEIYNGARGIETASKALAVINYIGKEDCE